MKREIVWIDDYSVGVKLFDDQHKMILNELNKLFLAFESDSEAEDLLAVLKDLVNYALVHFSSEEQLLERFKYQDLDAHKEQHRLFKHTIDQFMIRFESEGHRVIRETIEFLADWWMGHTQGCDKDYMRFLNNNGIY